MIEVAIKNFVEFEFSKPPLYGIQRLRLTPKESEKQKIITWDIIFKGARKETEYFDHHGNFCCLLTFEKDIKTISINAEGVVGIRKTIGVVNDVSEIPYWLFKRHTDLAKPGRSIREFCKQFSVDVVPDLDLVYDVAKRLKNLLTYSIGTTKIDTTAEEAFLLKTGVCQDFSHIFISCMRELNYPARYVSGYLKMDNKEDQEATHAWTEVYVDNLGWVGIDVSNNIIVDENYIVLATGFDYKDAKPLHGIQFESENNSIKTAIKVQQQSLRVDI